MTAPTAEALAETLSGMVDDIAFVVVFTLTGWGVGL